MFFRCALLCTVLMVLLGVTRGTLAQSPTAKPILERHTWEDLLEQYLVKDCGTGEKDPSRFLDTVVGLRERVRDRLLRIVREGPAPAWKKRIEIQARADFKQISTFTRRGGLDGVREKEIAKAARALAGEDYVAARWGFSMVMVTGVVAGPS